MGLLKQFEGMQLPAASELDWLVPEQDAPQKVQHFAYINFSIQQNSRIQVSTHGTQHSITDVI